MSVIFISHSSADNEASAEMKAWLEAQGHTSIFLDFDPAAGIPAGRDWEGELYRRLRLCRAVIVLCSPHSMASRWCFAEITQARALGKQIFPVQVAECTVDSVLSDRQVIDLTRDPEDGYRRLLHGLVQAGLDAADLFDWDGKRSPYPGLVALQEEDAGVFFGRDEEIGSGLDLLHQVRRQQDAGVVMLLGASGSGKSSLLRAGLLPRLRRDPERWLVVGPFRPGDDPLREFAVALSRVMGSGDAVGEGDAWRKLLGLLQTGGAAALEEAIHDLHYRSTGGGARVLVVIDQFEELLGQGKEHPAERFLEILRESIRRLEGRLVVLGTMRSDFLASFQKDPSLKGLKFRALTVGALSPTGLAEVIEKPAALAEVDLEPGLVPAILADTTTEDALPLMAFALRKLYEEFGKGGTLEVRGYRDGLGGLQGAVARAADSVVAGLSQEELSDLRSALLSMVRVDEDGHFARKPVARVQLPERALPVLERFVEARLLVARKDGTLEVAHESLFRAWRRLAQWLEENREALHLRNELRLAAGQWAEHGEDEEYLWTGGRLGRAVELRRAGRLILDREELRFLKGAEEHASRLRARSRLLRRGLLAAAVLVAIVSASLAWVAVRQRQAANREHMKSLAVLAGTGQNPMDLDLLLATVALEDSPVEARSSLFTLLSDAAYLESFFHGHRGLVWSLTFSPDGESVASGGTDGIRIWDRNGVPKGRLEDPRGEVVRVAFRPDGKVLAALRGTGRLLIWDPRTGERTERCPLPVDPEATGEASAECRDPDFFTADFDPQGRYLALGSQSGEVWVFAIVDQPGEDRRLRPVLQCAEGCGDRHSQLVVSLAFHPDGKRLATAGLEGVVKIWDLERGTVVGPPLVGHGRGARSLVYSPDGRLLAVGAGDGVVHLWRADEGRRVAASPAHPNAVKGLAFSADGRSLASGSVDGTLRLWPLRRDGSPQSDRLQQPQLEFSQLPGGLWSLAFDAGGRRLLGGSRNGAVRLWNLAVEPPLFRLQDQEWELRSANLDPRGRWAVTGDVDGSARLWNLTHPHEPLLSTRTLPCHGGDVRAVAFGNGGKVLAVGGRRVVVWDLAALGEEVLDCGAFEGEEAVPGVLAQRFVGEEIDDLDFHPQGNVLAVVSKNGLQFLSWGSGEGHPEWHRGEEGRVLSTAYHPQGEILTLGRPSGRITLLKTATLEPLELPPGVEPPRLADGVTELAFDSQGRYLAAASRDVTVQIWNTETWQPLWDLPQKSLGQVRAFAFQQIDDTALLAADGDNWMIQLWDVANGREVFHLGGHLGITYGLGFDERKRLISAGEDRTIRRWPLTLGDTLRNEACRRAGRNLTAQEWQQFVGGTCREPCAGLAPSGCL